MLAATLLFLVGLALGAAVVAAIWQRDRQGSAGTLARLEAERDAAIAAVQAGQTSLAATQTQLREAFSALSRTALKENREDFINNAEVLLTPVREALTRVQQQLTDVDKAREGSFHALTSRIGMLQQAHEQLRTAADGLSRSLGSPNIRGTWGEIQLRRIVDLSGMLEHCDFAEKEATVSEDGNRQTPDLIIKLPADGSIVVDSKVPIEAYRKAAEAVDARSRDQWLDAHARQFKEHIRALGAKEYRKQFQPAPEFVVMFLPLEPLMQAAFERDPSLLDLASDLGVIPATPMTLLALLKAVGSGWRQQQVARNAEQIHQIGRELYERLATLVEHLENVGRSIRQAGESYDRFVGSLEQKVLPGVRRFKELGVSSTKQIEELVELRIEVRPVVKAELTGIVDVESEREMPLLRE